MVYIRSLIKVYGVYELTTIMNVVCFSKYSVYSVYKLPCICIWCIQAD